MGVCYEKSQIKTIKINKRDSNVLTEGKDNKKKKIGSPINFYKSIHSSSITKKYFLFLEKKKKINIFICNKDLRNILGINNEVYKKLFRNK